MSLRLCWHFCSHYQREVGPAVIGVSCCGHPATEYECVPLQVISQYYCLLYYYALSLAVGISYFHSCRLALEEYVSRFVHVCTPSVVKLIK